MAPLTHWSSNYAITAAVILADATLLTFFLRTVLAKDHFFKSFMLAFPISLLSVLTIQHLYLAQQQRKLAQIDLTIFFFLAATQLYVFALGLLALAIRIAEWGIVNTTADRMKANRYQIMIIFNLVFIGLIAFYCLMVFNLEEIFKQDNFWLCVATTAISILFLAVADRVTANLAMEAVKRKIFHIGPILIIPLVYDLNHKVLTLIIVAAFALLFLLQVIRYQQQLMDEDEVEPYEWLQRVLGWLNIFYNWMGKFNQREKQFWFTHLFLALSLLSAYQLPQIVSSRIKLPGHLVLVLIAADGLAAFVGGQYGRLKIYGKKTLQGTTAFIVACFIGSYFLVPLNNIQLFLLSIGAGVAELFGGDCDNILTLLAYYGTRLSFIIYVRWRNQ